MEFPVTKDRHVSTVPALQTLILISKLYYMFILDANNFLPIEVSWDYFLASFFVWENRGKPKVITNIQSQNIISPLLFVTWSGCCCYKYRHLWSTERFLGWSYTRSSNNCYLLYCCLVIQERLLLIPEVKVIFIQYNKHLTVGLDLVFIEYFRQLKYFPNGLGQLKG